MPLFTNGILNVRPEEPGTQTYMAPNGINSIAKHLLCTAGGPGLISYVQGYI